MAATELTLGISISDRGVQAVEIEKSGPITTLQAIDEWENTFPLDGEDETGLNQFLEYLAAFIKVNRIKSQQASVALDTAFLFINTIPIPEGLTRVEMQEQVAWELGQYYPDTPSKEFVSDIHILSPNPATRCSDALSVSVRRRLVRTVEKALTSLGLTLNILDADHFSADMALRLNYPDTYRKYLALVGVKENRLDVSLMKNGNLQSYSYSLVQSNQEIISAVGKLSRDVQGLFSITVYGPHLDNDLLVQVRRGSALLVEALNPLRHVKIADSLRLADHLSVPSYRFASAVGVALRRD